MHFSRVIVILGVVIAGGAFLVMSASSEGEEALPGLNQLNDAFPTGFDNTWVALYDDTWWAAVLYGVLAVVALVLALLPPLANPMARATAWIGVVVGAVMTTIGVVATMGAMDDAEALEDGFAQAAALGAAEAWSVDIGFGWYLLIAGGVVVAIGGLMSALAKTSEPATA